MLGVSLVSLPLSSLTVSHRSSPLGLQAVAPAAVHAAAAAAFRGGGAGWRLVKPEID